MMESNDPKVKSYTVKRSPTSLQSVDFSVVNGENYAFFHLKNLGAVEGFRHQLESAPLQQTFVSMTTVDGKPMLVTKGALSAEELGSALVARGHALHTVKQHHAVDAWRIRSILGVVGQSLQLASSFMRPVTAENAGKGLLHRVDSSVFVFAASNLAANAVNFAYSKGQQVEDPHQLRDLKQQVNRDLALHLRPGEQAPDVEDRRLELRPKKDEPSDMLSQANGFMKKHSVAVGELGLRYLGAFGMAFPARKWKSQLATGNLRNALNESNLKMYTGLSSIAGKTVAISAKIPDPYNPKPHTWLDNLREKYSFLAGGWIETTSFAALAYDNFVNTGGEKALKSGIQNPVTGSIHRDWLGGIGASMFTAGYIVRNWAKYGERNVNMDELYAHTSDTLAAVAPEKVPQLLANTSARLAEHFKGKQGTNFATLYTHLSNDFQQYHAVQFTEQAALTSVENPTAADRSSPLPRVQTVEATVAPLNPKSAVTARIA